MVTKLKKDRQIKFFGRKGPARKKHGLISTAPRINALAPPPADASPAMRAVHAVLQVMAPEQVQGALQHEARIKAMAERIAAERWGSAARWQEALPVLDMLPYEIAELVIARLGRHADLLGLNAVLASTMAAQCAEAVKAGKLDLHDNAQWATLGHLYAGGARVVAASAAHTQASPLIVPAGNA